MRKEIVVGFLFLLSIGFVFAGSCNDDQTIMRLSSPTNSHVSFWNQNAGTYLDEICYNDIFGEDYNGADPHVCTGTNKVLTLYSESNSHASTTNDAIYTENVCFGDLACVYDSSAGSGCSNGGEVVVRMYQDYNSHVAYASDINYGIKVCCVSAGTYWADMYGNPIIEAEFGDTVQLISRGTVAGDMTIKEDDLLTDDLIKVVSGGVVGDNVVGTWTITSEDLDKTSDYDGFYFEMEGGNKKSGFLTISLQGSDDPIDVNIVSPVCGNYYDDGANVNVSIFAGDGDDLISGEVKIDGKVVKSFSNGVISFDHVFDSSGNSQVLVEATNVRGGKFKTISNIMILEKSGSAYVDGKYVAACIFEPKDFSNIDGSIVNFDASTTRGVKVTNGVLDVLVPSEGDTFSWYWNFMPEDVDRIIENTVDPFAYKFTAGFPIAGNNWATLKVEI
ncbi:MAG: hypothetical protein V1888_03095 [archaeon]